MFRQLTPRDGISEEEKRSNYGRIIREGIFTEIMTTLTGTVFLSALLIRLNAAYSVIGIIAALPSICNIFQLASIWMVRKTNNRRLISVWCSILARIPLILIGIIILQDLQQPISSVLGFLFIYYLFASMAGPAWNAWMKDFLPLNELGSFFSRRTLYMQIVSVIVSLCVAGVLSLIKGGDPQLEVKVYGWLFIVAGVSGLLGVTLLARVPEPVGTFQEGNLWLFLKAPLRDANFKKLLLFQSVWILAFNMATPFFTVFMLKTVQLPISTVVIFTLVSQVSSILSIKTWGRLSDRYSNKTILAILLPVYMISLLLWCFIDQRNNFMFNMALLGLIHLLVGMTQSGITQAINTITLKLSPAPVSIVYLSMKNIITAMFGSFAPIVGGVLVDLFTNRKLEVLARYEGAVHEKIFYILTIHEWTFLFLIAAFIVFIAAQILTVVDEHGETDKDFVVDFMRSNIMNNVKSYFVLGSLLSLFKWKEEKEEKE